MVLEGFVGVLGSMRASHTIGLCGFLACFSKMLPLPSSLFLSGFLEGMGKKDGTFSQLLAGFCMFLGEDQAQMALGSSLGNILFGVLGVSFVWS